MRLVVETGLLDYFPVSACWVARQCVVLYCCIVMCGPAWFGGFRLVLGNSMANNVAITAADFDKFRIAVAAAISTLDKRIDSVLNQSNLEC